LSNQNAELDFQPPDPENLLLDKRVGKANWRSDPMSRFLELTPRKANSFVSVNLHSESRKQSPNLQQKAK